jgi:DNA modification methylase
MSKKNNPLGAQDVRALATTWLKSNLPREYEAISLGLPEVDDRYDTWRVALLSAEAKAHLGELQLSIDGSVVKNTRLSLVRSRLSSRAAKGLKRGGPRTDNTFKPATIPNKAILGDAAAVLEEFPSDTAQLVVTSPPYYNAKPEYSEYLDYQEYLDFLRRIVTRCNAVLSEGRFFIINVSPVLIRRASRNSSSRRIPIPFDVHRIMDRAGFDFIDDIIWVKPEGAGWSLGRGRRFAADRQPLQYKPVPVTEYVLVYRKRTTKLIDWNIRAHFDPGAVKRSRIDGAYDVTNIWKIAPGHHKHHPAVFPEDLVSRLIRYYSFEGDLVLDPFAGTGTTARAALRMNRRFLMIERNPEYFDHMKKGIDRVLKKEAPKLRVYYEEEEYAEDDPNK